MADQLLQVVRSQPGSKSSDVLESLDTVANIHQSYGRLDEAIPLFEEEVARAKDLFGPTSPRALNAMQSLGQAYQEAGRWTDAQKLLEETLRLYRAGDISENPDAAGTMAKLGLTLICQGQFAQAEPPLRDALAIFAKLPPDWPAAYTQSLLGAALAGETKYAEAEPLLLQGYRCMKVRENQIPGNRAKLLADAAQRLVALYTAWGKPAAAPWSATLDELRKSSPAPAIAPATAPSN